MENIYNPLSDIDLFPQRLTIFECPLNKDPFIKQIYSIQKTIPNLIKGYPKELMYQTPNNLFDISPIFNPLKDYIKFLILKNYKVHCEFTSSWANIGYQYSSTKFHTHSPSYLSGVYYLKVSNNSGNLGFNNRYNISEVKVFSPSENSIFIFDGNQPHSTDPNLDKSPKICISFNLKKLE